MPRNGLNTHVSAKSANHLAESFCKSAAFINKFTPFHTPLIFTDGDLRRTLDQNIDIHNTLIDDVMTRGCKTATASMLAAEALAIMDNGKISVLAVIDESNKPVGAIHLHDLLKAGVA